MTSGAGIIILLFQQLTVPIKIDFAVLDQDHTVDFDETDSVTAVVVPGANLDLVAQAPENIAKLIEANVKDAKAAEEAAKIVRDSKVKA